MKILYAYIAKPTKSQVAGFLGALEGHGIPVSHLGKSDPPRKFRGSADEASSVICSGTELTNDTFARSADRQLDLDFKIPNDPRWTHSTVSAACPDTETLRLIAECAVSTFDLFIVIRGDAQGGKGQAWEVLHVTPDCPADLRARFSTT